MRTALHIALALLMLLAGVDLASAGQRVALVIGNSNYAETARLKNPANDAARLAETLTAIGFSKVTLKLDLAQSELRRALGQFSRDAAGADIALIYFAGHGIEVGDTNYVIPTDAQLSHVDDVEFEAIELSKLMSSLNRAGTLKLVILDACRNNPFKQNMQSTGSTRSVGRGLARVNPTGSDTLVAYAAKEGTVVSDGDGDNSPYAQALIKHIVTPGINVRLMFGRVHDDVVKSTGRRQEPFTYGALGGKAIYLKPPAQKVATAPDAASTPKQPSPINTDALFWDSVKDSKDAGAFKAYLRQFPDGTFAGLAKLRLKALGKKVATVAPTQPNRVPTTQAECDRLAANTLPELKGMDDGRPLKLDDLQSAAVVLACEAAVKEFPERARNHYQLGRAYYARQDYMKANKSFRNAASMGTVEAKNYLGRLYQHGKGVSADLAEAVRWYREAADAGNALGMLFLAMMYDSGYGVARDLKEALRWYNASAEKGSAVAMFWLGALNASGRGGTQDYAKAGHYFRKAAEHGHAYSMAMVGVMYSEGLGVERDDVEAVRWLRKGAESRDPTAMFGLAMIVEEGRGVPVDHAAAADWMYKAVAAKHEDAVRMLTDGFKKSLSPQFLKELQTRLRNAGFYKGEIDGTLNEKTKAAVRKLAGPAG